MTTHFYCTSRDSLDNYCVEMMKAATWIKHVGDAVLLTLKSIRIHGNNTLKVAQYLHVLERQHQAEHSAKMVKTDFYLLIFSDICLIIHCSYIICGQMWQTDINFLWELHFFCLILMFSLQVNPIISTMSFHNSEKFLSLNTLEVWREHIQLTTCIKSTAVTTTQSLAALVFYI